MHPVAILFPGHIRCAENGVWKVGSKVWTGPPEILKRNIWDGGKKEMMAIVELPST